ncbi:MFS transporter [Candidatus Woesearchaeota archaeon]|nr:MFS transporter [Candidatus Woesearchaeota archaeon]
MSDYKKRLESNIWKFYLFDIFAAMLFSIPIMVLFWQENGLSLTQVMFLQSLFSIAMVILEIPTGYLADLFGRKKILFLSGMNFLIGVSVYSIGFNFISFLMAELFFALAVSFYSGTGSAFIYETLIDLKQKNNYSKIWGNAKFYGLLAIAFANVVGGLVGELNLRWTLYLSIPFMALLIPITLSLHEPKKNKFIAERGHLHNLSKILKFSLIKNIKLRWIIIFSAVIYSLNSAGLWLYQPYFKLTGIDIAYFGVIFASFQIVAAISSKYAHRIENKLGSKLSLILLIPIIFVGYLLMSKILFLFSFIFIFLFQFVRGFSEPIFSDYVNKLAKPDLRATVLSVSSLVQKLLYSILMPFVGWIADVYSLLQALTISGIVTLISGIIILLILRKNKLI